MFSQSTHSLTIDQLKEKIRYQLSGLHYSNSSIENYICYAGTIQRYMKKIGVESYSEKVGYFWLEECRKRNIKEKSFVRYQQAVQKLNDILNEKALVIRRRNVIYDVPSEYSDVFCAYLRDRKSKKCSEGTMTYKRRNASYFFTNLTTIGCYAVNDITAEIISKVSIMRQTSAYITTIRDLLSFMLDEELISADYTPLLPKIRRVSPTPSVYTKEERREIENLPDTSTSMGKRDKAMILLATRNGFRAGNIAALRIDDIDFMNETIHIDEQVKTHMPLTSALLPDVKKAIIDYIDNGRPKSDIPYVFLKTRLPYNEVNSDIVYNVVSKYIRKSSIEPKGRKIGPHAMRSSLTSSGINNGMTYEEMRVVIGHKSAEAIKHYAELNDTELRKCTMPVNKPSGQFSKYLEGKAVCYPL